MLSSERARNENILALASQSLVGLCLWEHRQTMLYSFTQQDADPELQTIVDGIQNNGFHIGLQGYFYKTAGFAYLFFLHTSSPNLLKSAKNDTEPKKITTIKQKPQEEGK